MKISVIASIVLILLSTAGAAAQAPPAKAAVCPKVRATGPSSDVKPGESITFVADVSGGDTKVDPTYNWSVSAGAISSGQGTPVIMVDTTGLGGQTVTATVDVGGFDRSCSTASSSSTSVMMDVQARKFDEYGQLKLKDEQARLDNFVIQMQMDPTVQGYVIAYAGRKSKAGAAAVAITRAKTHVTKTRRMDPARIVTLDGGYREEPATELWIVPAGATPPQASPTVDPAEIKKPLKKPVKKKS